MIRYLASLLVVSAAVAFAACGGDDDAAGGVPTQPQPGGGTAVGASTPPPSPGDATAVSDDGASVLDITAANIRFVRTELSAPSGSDIIARMTNIDSGIAHNVRFYDGPTTSNASLGATSITSGPAREDLRLGQLAPGAYLFACDVHPEMQGTLSVQER